MAITLIQILQLVGRLDDASSDDSPRERFRRFLQDNAPDVGQVRDYVEECLRNTGDQYNRALQDLVNHLGSILEFDVTYGRYQGVRNQIGFDGHWRSASNGFHIIVEVKTTETYAIKLHTVASYIDQLIEAQTIPSWDHAMGLFVIGRPDPDLRQLEDAIIAQKRIQQFRIISVDSLLSLAEMMREYDITHDDILSVIKPSGPKIDSIVNLMARLVAEPQAEQSVEQPSAPLPAPTQAPSETAYWMTPVKSDDEQTAEEVIETLVRQEKIYAFGDRTPGRRDIKPGDWISFYATGTGVVAHARVKSRPENKAHPKVRHPEQYPWTFRLEQPKLYLENPVVIDAQLRSQLDAFDGRDPNTSYWAWLVQATRRLSEHDFRILTRQGSSVMSSLK